MDWYTTFLGKPIRYPCTTTGCVAGKGGVLPQEMQYVPNNSPLRILHSTSLGVPKIE